MTPAQPLVATGSLDTREGAPTLHVTGGAGNTPDAEVHLAIRTEEGGRTRLIQGWFNADDLLDRITDALEAGRDRRDAAA